MKTAHAHSAGGIAVGKCHTIPLLWKTIADGSTFGLSRLPASDSWNRRDRAFERRTGQSQPPMALDNQERAVDCWIVNRNGDWHRWRGHANAVDRSTAIAQQRLIPHFGLPKGGGYFR